MGEQEAIIDAHQAQVESALQALAQELGVEYGDLNTLYLFSGAQRLRSYSLRDRKAHRSSGRRYV